MRLFIAIDLPDEINAYCKELQKPIQKTNNHISYPCDFHITLLFLGEVTPQTAESIKQKLSTISFKPFTLQLDTLGVFPSPSEPRVVWLGIKPNESLLQLHEDILTALKTKDDRPFVPHLTLGRIKELKDKDQFKQTVTAIKIGSKEFTVNSFCLIKSTLTPLGSVYQVIGRSKISSS